MENMSANSAMHWILRTSLRALAHVLRDRSLSKTSRDIHAVPPPFLGAPALGGHETTTAQSQ